MKFVAIIAALCLASCQTVRIQGVEINAQTQWFAVAAAVAMGVYLATEDDDVLPAQKCAQFLSVPTGKGGNICVEAY